MGKVTVGVDLDNTFWNLGETVVKMLNQKYDLNVKYEDCPYNLDTVFSQFSQFDTDINDWYYQGATSSNVYEDAKTVINYIKKELEYDVYFCTSSTPEELVVKNKRLKAIFDWFDGTQLICCHDKKLIKFNIMIDDLASHFSDTVDVKILYNQPYNQDERSVYRAYNWLQVLRYISAY